MSEITREQVERAIDAMKRKRGMWHVMADALGNDWATTNGLMRVPPDVHLAWRHGDWFGTVDALERWLSTFPPAKVARWVPEAGRYTLTPPSEHMGPGHDIRSVSHVSSCAQAIAWGYTIEGGPEPVHECTGPDCCSVVDMSLVKPAEDSPERLKARREALGMNQAAAAYDLGLAMLWHDLDRLETTRTDDDAIDRARYAAALTAEEQRRADILADNAAQAAEDREAHAQQRMADLAAPEVVDVPQPIVKRASVDIDGRQEDQYATWCQGSATIHLRFVRDDGEAAEEASIPLLRAMLAAIDAQQPVASPFPPGAPSRLDPERPEPRFKVGDWVRDPHGDVRRITSITDDARWSH